MILPYWNALRVGDAVVVHDDASSNFAISSGTVTGIDTGHPTNNVAIRVLDTDGAGRIVRPRRLAVHLAAGDSSGSCWRCCAGSNPNPGPRTR